MTKREKCLTILLAVVIFTGIVTTSITYKANNTLQNTNEEIKAQNAALITENNDKNETNKLLCNTFLLTLALFLLRAFFFSSSRFRISSFFFLPAHFLS